MYLLNFMFFAVVVYNWLCYIMESFQPLFDGFFIIIDTPTCLCPAQ